MADNTFKLTIHMVSSLDGIIAKTDNSVSWFDTVDQYEQGITLNEQETTAFLKTIDCYVMGYHTYEHALKLSESYGWVYGDVPTIVVTHQSLVTARQNVEFFSGDLNVLVQERLKPKYSNVWMVGGPTLAKDLIRLQLVDEIRLSIIPIILGEGKLFFDHIAIEQRLHLKDVKGYKNGIAELCYEVKK